MCMVIVSPAFRMIINVDPYYLAESLAQLEYDELIDYIDSVADLIADSVFDEKLLKRAQRRMLDWGRLD